MSVESEQLERSMLERKDRDELHRIANAMGGKPGSRARKAEIIDVILELAGVGAEEPDAEAEEAADDTPSEAPPKRAPRARGGNGRRGTQGEATDQDAAPPAPAAEPEARDDNDDDTGNDRDDDGDSDEDRDGNDRDGDDDDGDADEDDAAGDERPARSEGRRDDANSDRSGGNGRSGQGQGQSNPRQGGQAGQGGQGTEQQNRDDGESGNRRRRRRGRNRDRDREGGAGEAQPVADEQWQGEPVDVTGLLDLRDEGYGFLRVKGYLPSKDDVYVSVKQVRQFGLRKGDHLTGTSRPAGRSEKNPALLRIDAVNEGDPDGSRSRPKFEDLTPLFPDEKLKLESGDDPHNMTVRIIDLISPIGKGQRGLIVSPPKAGKTTIMKTIAKAVERNNPETHVIVLLVDERPEEVTDFKRSLERGEVVASTFDRPSDEHTMVSELVIERAKRLVEDGRDVFILLDGITRLSRAYNLAAPASGRIMSGGIDASALYPPKKFFGAARNLEEGGSLTILATALVETNSKMDDHIFEEFKGTGNMELKLDRRTAERRVYPAIDVDASSTRHEELLFDRKELQQVWKLRRVLSSLSGDSGNHAAGLEMLTDRLTTFRTNAEFLAEVAKAPAG